MRGHSTLTVLLGNRYSTDASGTNLPSLSSVSMVTSNNGWAVGANGVIFQWNGNYWTKVNSPTSSKLYRVKMTSATDGWAVGYGGVILRYH